MKRRLFLFVALTLLATVAADVVFSAASFTTASSTAVEASTSQLTDDWLQLNAGNNQSATAGTAVATKPSVLVTDANNNPVSGSRSPSRSPRAAARSPAARPPRTPRASPPWAAGPWARQWARTP